MYTLSSNILKWSYNQKNEDGQHLEAVSHSIGYYSMTILHVPLSTEVVSCIF